MRTDQSVTVHRSEYLPATHRCSQIKLTFDLDTTNTQVTAQHSLMPTASGQVLKLNGSADLHLISIQIDDQPLPSSRYTLEADTLSITGIDHACTLTIVGKLNPETNKALSGLYVSGGNFFTQCEAEGFRRITWFQDRPDVMSLYEVLIRANAKAFPVLLSNGNLISSGPLPDGRHFAQWEDPFPKPCYLFALVAGYLVANEQTIMRHSGRSALLQVWVKPGQLDRTHHAMISLKKSIDWDVERFGLDLDLDRFMIVAVDDFNMGAMENKGLNLFNSAYVFATPLLASDTDYDSIESIVGHEYFHNWTGNRITCRDWFQLTLKEGLTVFRDQEFSADMAAKASANPKAAQSARAVNRIQAVALLRRAQFAEDAGPMAHPIRPDSYSEIDNFYTVTVYEKGAEVIRMMQTLVGRDGFREGMDLYFSRHDGQAVRCEEFVAAIADANQVDLTQFSRWYSQAHTPIIKVNSQYDQHKRQLALTFTQHLKPTQLAFHIPIVMGLISANGENIQFAINDLASAANTEHTLELREMTQTFYIDSVSDGCVPSLARAFSAPVIIDYPYSIQDLALLARADHDAFNRWDAVQTLAIRACTFSANEPSKPETAALILALSTALADPSLSPAFKAELLTLPAETVLIEKITPVNPQALRHVRLSLMKQVGQGLEGMWPTLYQQNEVSGDYSFTPENAGKRALRQACLTYWALTGKADTAIIDQYNKANNMTEKLGAMLASRLAGSATEARVLAAFANDYRDEPLALDKWLSAQATKVRTDPAQSPVLETVQKLLAAPGFDRDNPNRLRAIFGAFVLGNPAEFHRADGRAYDFWVNQIILIDATNPNLAARLARALDRWPQFTQPLQVAMKAALTRLAQTKGLSTGTLEIVNKALSA
jgi:aminopeptidase N